MLLSKKRICLQGLLWLTISAIAQQSGNAQQPAAAPSSAITTLRVDTKLTIVDVTVSDKNGNPVHGLKQSDFVIKEDGKPQPIRNFDEFGTAVPPHKWAPACANVLTGIPERRAFPAKRPGPPAQFLKLLDSPR